MIYIYFKQKPVTGRYAAFAEQTAAAMHCQTENIKAFLKSFTLDIMRYITYLGMNYINMKVLYYFISKLHLSKGDRDFNSIMSLCNFRNYLFDLTAMAMGKIVKM